MRVNRRRRLNRNAAEQLLRGGSAGRPLGQPADHDALASLLVAAAAPAHDSELAGEAEAVMAFRNALADSAHQQRRPSMSVTKLLAAKAVLAALGVTVAGGGVALAAATGHLPSSLTGSSAASSTAASATATPSMNQNNSTSHPTASPSPSLRGLCQAYTAGVANSNGKALDNPAFSVLITKAGGKDKVSAFCTSLLATSPGNKPTSHATGKPSSHPTQANNTSHPTSKPATTPTSHPTGKPTSHS